MDDVILSVVGGKAHAKKFILVEGKRTNERVGDSLNRLGGGAGANP